MISGINLYASNDIFTVHKFKDREEWLKKRIKGIGGSDASAVIGQNPYKTNEQLYREKLNLSSVEDISDKPYVRYGLEAEKHLRALFGLEYEEIYEVQYIDNVILQNNAYKEQLYSPDGLILEKKTGRKGIYEGKTTRIVQSYQKESWKDSLPQNYFIQTLHGLSVTEFDFVILRAQLIYGNGYSAIRDYLIEREDNLEDIKYLREEVHKFYVEHIEKQVPPPLRIVI